MTTNSSGAVFFLGTRAHYQVLQQPETRYDVENGNDSTETIYQNPSVQELWSNDKQTTKKDSKGNFKDIKDWGYDNDVSVNDEKDKLDFGSGVKRRTKRRQSQSETTLCDKDNEMKPALLNNMGDNDTPKSKTPRRRINLLTFVTSLARRKRRLDNEQMQYLQHLESALTACTYRESCRCLECQSRYFECDESDEYTSDESDYATQYITQALENSEANRISDDDDDEVFIDSVPGDNTSTDLLLEGPQPKPMSVSSDETESDPGRPEDMELEVAAGTPVLLNYLLTHPITCSVQ